MSRSVMRGWLRQPWVLAAAPVLVLALAFYAWTAATSTTLFPGGELHDPYNRLVDGLSHGHTYLPLRPDPGLLRLADPYDPRLNAPFVGPDVRDLSLYDGRLYAYWGASPAIVLFAPWRLLGVGDLSPGLAVLLFSAIGLLCSIAVLRLIVRRWAPATPAWMQAFGIALLAFGNMAPWLLRRPEAYEVAIAGGFCFLWAGLLAVGCALARNRRRPWLLALGSLLVGLAFAARPPLGIAILLVAAAAWTLRARGDVRVSRLAIAALAPFAVCVGLVGIYNAVRFGSPADFGVTHQLSGERADHYNSLSYVAPGLWYYLLCPLRPRIEFPFLWVNVPGSVPFPTPHAYNGTERTAGILPVFPLLLVLFAAPWVLRRAERALRWILGGMVAAGAVVMVFAAYYYWGAVQRYEMDYLALLLVPALVVWFMLAGPRAPGRRTGRAVAVAGAVLCVWGVVAMAAMSLIGSDDLLRQRHPGTFDALADAFSPAATALAQVAGHPVLAAVADNPLAGPARYDRLGVDGADQYIGLAPIPIDIVAPGTRTATLTMRLRRTRTTPRGRRLILQERLSDGSVFSVPARPGRVEFPVVLRSGSNVVHLQLFADRSFGISPYPDSEDDGAVQVLDLHVADRRPTA